MFLKLLPNKKVIALFRYVLKSDKENILDLQPVPNVYP